MKSIRQLILKLRKKEWAVSTDQAMEILNGLADLVWAENLRGEFTIKDLILSLGEKRSKKKPILMEKAVEMNHYFYVVMDEGNAFFETGEELLNFLRNNNPIECGASLFTEDEWAKVKGKRL